MRLYERTTEQVRAELCAFCGEAHWPETCPAARKYGRTMRRLARSLEAQRATEAAARWRAEALRDTMGLADNGPGALGGCAEVADMRISIDNGLSYTDADGVPAHDLERLWDAICERMDDDTRESVHSRFVSEDRPETTDKYGWSEEDAREFLRRYLAAAPCDLVIG